MFRTHTKLFLHIPRKEILALSLSIILSKISLSKTFLNLAMSVDTHRITRSSWGPNASPNGTASGPWIIILQVQVKDTLHRLLLGLIAIDGGHPLKGLREPPVGLHGPSVHHYLMLLFRLRFTPVGFPLPESLLSKLH